jgi:hypothetical protein
VLSAARGLGVALCNHDPGYVDVFDPAHPEEIIHVRMDDFAAFQDQVIAGDFAYLRPEAPRPDGPPAPGPGP